MDYSFSSVRQLKWTELRFWLLIVRWNMLSGFLAKTKLTFYIGFKSWLLYLSVVTGEAMKPAWAAAMQRAKQIRNWMKSKKYPLVGEHPE